MLKWFVPRSGLCLLLLCSAVAACQTVSSAIPTPTLEPTLTTSAATAEITPEASPTRSWKQVEVRGIQLRIAIPPGWETQETEEGLLLAEHFGTMEFGSTIEGMQVHLFVHALDGYNLPASRDANVAWAVLEQIITRKEVIGSARVSSPQGFDWDGLDAAYYLLNDGSGNRSVLVAIAIPTPMRLVVCNFSSPADQAAEIRAMLPQILSTLTINGSPMNINALRNLPDPLDFPEDVPPEDPPQEQ